MPAAPQHTNSVHFLPIVHFSCSFQHPLYHQMAQWQQSSCSTAIPNLYHPIKLYMAQLLGKPFRWHCVVIHMGPDYIWNELENKYKCKLAPDCNWMKMILKIWEVYVLLDCGLLYPQIIYCPTFVLLTHYSCSLIQLLLTSHSTPTHKIVIFSCSHIILLMLTSHSIPGDMTSCSTPSSIKLYAWSPLLKPHSISD